MTQSFFSRFRNLGQRSETHALPGGLRVYAVGDVHGRYDCLRQLEERVARHEAAAEPVAEAIVIFLGDYVDRGPASRDVLEHLSSGSFAGLRTRCLMGNHEDAMLGFIEDAQAHAAWLNFGGMATLASYGVRPAAAADANGLAALQQGLREAVPRHHVRFLESLELWIELGSVLFVHAGIRPGLALSEQRRMDLLAIREPFMTTKARLPWRVVHGHTVMPEPILGPYRVSLDTGAYATGRLTCAVLQENAVTLLS